MALKAQDMNATTFTGTLSGNASSATKLTTSAGSASQPVYFSGGKPVVISYTIAKSVPSDAKFTDTTYSAATTSAAGLMSAADKSKLDGIATGANKYSLPTASSSTLGGVKTTSTVTSTSGYTACPIISGVPYYKDTNTTYSLSSFGITATATELNYTDGVTSNIQTQLNGKLSTSGTAAKASALQGVYTSNGGAQPPSYVGANSVKCNMMNQFTGTSISFSNYADVLMMNAYSWSDVPYATALAIQKTNGIPRAWIAAGGNTDAWAGATEIITANNIGNQSVNYATSSGSSTTATKLGTDAGSATQPVYFSSGKPVACTYTLGKSVPSNAVFTDTNTHYTTRIYAGASGTAANAAATSPYIKITDDNTYRNQIRLVGGGATTVTSDANGNITITSTDTNTNTTYSAGTGLSLSSTTFSVKYGTAAGTACQGNDSRLSDSRTPKSHNQAASTITAGTFGGQVIVPASTAYTTNHVRNGVFTTTDPGAGASSSHANGSIIYVYE